MYHRAPRQAGAQEACVKIMRACERASSRGCASAAHSPQPCTQQPPLPAGRAQVCAADDAVLVGRVEPLESRQRPLLNAKAAFSHVPKNNIKTEIFISTGLQGGSGRMQAVAGSAVLLRAAHPTPPRSSVGAENYFTAHLPASLCHPRPSLPTSRWAHGHMAMPGTGHPLRWTPREGPCTLRMGTCGAAAAAAPAQSPAHAGPSDQTHRHL